MATQKYKTFFCKWYGELADRVCPKINSDDWDELEDCCSHCSGKSVIETEVYEFQVKCIKTPELENVEIGTIVPAYVWSDKHFVVNGRLTHINEFMKCYEIV